MTTRTRVSRTLAIAAILATSGLQGCLGGSTEPVVATGSFTLQSVNGAALPYTFSNGTVLKSEVLTLAADGTYTDAITHADNTTAVDVGNYSVFAGVVTFGDITIGTQYQASIDGNRMTVVIGTFTEIFTRQ